MPAEGAIQRVLIPNTPQSGGEDEDMQEEESQVFPPDTNVAQMAKAFLGESQLATQFQGTQFSARSALIQQQEDDSIVSHVSESVPPAASNLSGAHLSAERIIFDDSGEDTQAAMTAFACGLVNAGTFSATNTAQREMERLQQAHREAGNLSRSHSGIYGEASMSLDQDQGIDPSATYPQAPESSSGQEIARLVQQRPPWTRNSIGSNASDLRADRSNQSENLSHDFSTTSHVGDISAAPLPDSPGDLPHAPHSTAHQKNGRVGSASNVNMTWPELPEDTSVAKSTHTSNTSNVMGKSTDYLVPLPAATIASPKNRKMGRRVSWQDANEDESASAAPYLPKPKSPPQPVVQAEEEIYLPPARNSASQATQDSQDIPPVMPDYLPPKPQPVQEEESQDSLPLRGTGDTTMTSEHEVEMEATQPAPNETLPTIENSRHSESVRKMQRERFASMFCLPLFNAGLMSMQCQLEEGSSVQQEKPSHVDNPLHPILNSMLSICAIRKWSCPPFIKLQRASKILSYLIHLLLRLLLSCKISSTMYLRLSKILFSKCQILRRV